jgi:hypothetical protein
VEQLGPFLELLVVDDARVSGVQLDEARDIHWLVSSHVNLSEAPVLSEVEGKDLMAIAAGVLVEAP